MKALAEQIGDIDGVNIHGRVVGVKGLMVEIAGPIHAMSVGARIVIETGGNRFIPAEVIGFSGNNAVVMPFAGLEGVRRGCKAVIANAANMVRPSPAWLGRVINAMAEPIDGKGPLPQGASPMPYRNMPPPAHSRKRVGAPLDLGVRSLNTFLTCCRGQRLGIFAGSVFPRCDFRGNGRGVAGSFEVIGNGLIFVEANEAGIGADEALVEDAAGQLVEFIFFQGLQHAGADFGGDGDFLERDLALFALQFQFFAKGRQTSLPLSLDGERNFTLSKSKIIGHCSTIRQT